MNDPTHVAAADQQVLITRIFDAPCEQVFKAWTDPDQVAAWYGPEHFDTPRERIQTSRRLSPDNNPDCTARTSPRSRSALHRRRSRDDG